MKDPILMAFDEVRLEKFINACAPFRVLNHHEFHESIQRLVDHGPNWLHKVPSLIMIALLLCIDTPCDQ
jgi:hypothetical protein